jgi:hypothetical protein
MSTQSYGEQRTVMAYIYTPAVSNVKTGKQREQAMWKLTLKSAPHSYMGATGRQRQKEREKLVYLAKCI